MVETEQEGRGAADPEKAGSRSGQYVPKLFYSGRSKEKIKMFRRSYVALLSALPSAAE